MKRNSSSQLYTTILSLANCLPMRHTSFDIRILKDVAIQGIRPKPILQLAPLIYALLIRYPVCSIHINLILFHCTWYMVIDRWVLPADKSPGVKWQVANVSCWCPQGVRGNSKFAFRDEWRQTSIMPSKHSWFILVTSRYGNSFRRTGPL